MAHKIKPLDKLTPYGRKMMLEYYRRCDETHRHFTPTIWTIPTAAGTLNVAAYTALYGEKQYDWLLQVGVLFLLFILNAALMWGALSHSEKQKAFGNRCVEIEEANGIRKLEFETRHAATCYVIVMAIVTALSLVVLWHVAQEGQLFCIPCFCLVF